VIRLPKQTVKKRTTIELVPKFTQTPQIRQGGFGGLAENFLKVFPIIPFL
jgi:hypothetical protein